MMDLNKIRVSQTDNMQTAIATLDKAAVRIVVVLDDANRLLGTITDGDIRRALLRHMNMDTSVSEIMNSSPVTASVKASRSEVLLMMARRKLLHMPIVDQSGCLVDINMLQDHVYGVRHENPVLLMAGGFGKRLRPLTNTIPKPLLPIGSRTGQKPILEIMLKQCADAGFTNFIISTHYKAEMLKEHFADGSAWGVQIRYAHEAAPLGTAGALGLLPDDLPDLPILVVNGDLVTSVDLDGLIRFHNEQGGIATVCVKQYDHQVPYGVVEVDGTRVATITEKPVFKYFVSAGMYVIEPAAIDNIRRHGYIDMPDFLCECIEDNKRVNMFPIHEKWRDIGRINEYQEALKMTGTG